MSENKPKFTPGPWCAEYTRVYSAKGIIIRQDWWDTDAEREEAKANAALIAAAPDMYEVLKLFADKFGDAALGVEFRNLSASIGKLLAMARGEAK